MTLAISKPYKTSVLDNNARFDFPVNFEVNSTPTKFKGALEQNDLFDIKNSILGHERLSLSPTRIKLIMNTPTAFTSVSKKEFSQTIIDAMQSKEGREFSALVAMVSSFRENKKYASNEIDHKSLDLSRLSSLVYTPIGSIAKSTNDSLSSFESGEFAWAPLTEQEVRAIPALMGVYDDIFKEVGLDYSNYAATVADKMVANGFKDVANIILENAGLPLKEIKERRIPVSLGTPAKDTAISPPAGTSRPDNLELALRALEFIRSKSIHQIFKTGEYPRNIKEVLIGASHLVHAMQLNDDAVNFRNEIGLVRDDLWGIRDLTLLNPNLLNEGDRECLSNLTHSLLDTALSQAQAHIPDVPGHEAPARSRRRQSASDLDAGPSM